MTNVELQKALDILEAMPAGRDQDAKWAKLRQLYALVLKPMTNGEGLAAVQHAALTEEWRPSPARLRQIAAAVFSPMPDAEQTYAEVMHLARTAGLHGRKVSGRPHCFLTGPPEFSHPVVERVVRFCGGWEMICTGEAGMQEGLKKQVRSAHASLAAEWQGRVFTELCKPLEARDARCFPAWTPCPLEDRVAEVGAVPEPLALEGECGPWTMDGGPWDGEVPEFVRRVADRLGMGR